MSVLLVDEFSALRLGNAAALFERPRSFSAGIVLAAQSVEGLHDVLAERHRLLNSASTLIAHRLADPDPVVTRAGTIRRPERSHQLDSTGATGMGSLRLQDTYRIDPNDLRSLPPGVAWVITGGRAAKVAVSRAGSAGTPALVRAGAATVELNGAPIDQQPEVDEGPNVAAAEPEVTAGRLGRGAPWEAPIQLQRR